MGTARVFTGEAACASIPKMTRSLLLCWSCSLCGWCVTVQDDACVKIFRAILHEAFRTPAFPVHFILPLLVQIVRGHAILYGFDGTAVMVFSCATAAQTVAKTFAAARRRVMLLHGAIGEVAEFYLLTLLFSSCHGSVPCHPVPQPSLTSHRA